MKKILITIVSLFFCSVLFSQDKLNLRKDVHNIDFHGVDFSRAKVFGAKETPEQFAVVFEAINMLLINENKKYNLEKFLSKDDVVLHIGHLKPSYADIASNKKLKLDDNHYSIAPEAIESLIQEYDVDYKHEIGAVLIAELLNKSGSFATYKFVFFDNNTKDIIATYSLKCKAAGFGLRNFWAKSVYNAMKNIKLGHVTTHIKN